MRILNIMLGKGKGGLEQASLDYADMLTFKGHMCLTVSSKRSWLSQQLKEEGLGGVSIRQWGTWDYLAVRELKRIAEFFKPDFIIAHGNRALGLSEKAFCESYPLIGVAHNERFQRRTSLKHVFAVSPHLAQNLSLHKTENDYIFPPDKVTVIPNTVRMREFPPKSVLLQKKDILTIGTLGRLSPEKGIDLFLEALSILKKENLPFRAIIAGDGNEKEILKQKTASLGLENQVEFLGWVDDKPAFFNQIDIFCMPSKIESFGIALLESFASVKPVVCSTTSGPLSIARHNYNALFFRSENVEEMAKMLKVLLKSPEKRYQLAESGYHTARQSYDFCHVSCVLEQALINLLPSRPLFPRLDQTDEMRVAVL